MKKIFTFFFIFFIIYNFAFSIDNKFFKYSFGGYSSAVDVKNGNDLNCIESYENFENKELLNYYDIYIAGKNYSSFFHTEYIEGLKSKEYSKVYDEHEYLFLYDESFNLLSNSENKYFVYISENIRKHINSGKLDEIQEIETAKDYIKIKYTEFSSKLADGLIFNNGYIIDEYFYQGDKLVHFEKNLWNKNNVHSKFTEKIDYLYDDKNKLVSVCQKIGEEVRFVRNIIYDGNNKMKKIQKINKLNPKENEDIFFEDYDKYNNWRKLKVYRNSKLVEEITRTIFYISNLK